MTAVADHRVHRSVARARGRTARLDEWMRTGAVAVTWLFGLLVTFWWISDGGIGDLAGAASGATSLGRLFGLWASALLLVQVVMMARVPALERAFGQDRLAHLHRLVGFTSFNLLLGHIVLIVWGYAVADLGAVPGTIWDLTVNDPGMLLAVAGSACLVMVVVTSVKAARRRLRYESWHLLHLYGYLGAGLALPHQLWTGEQFIGSPRVTAGWWAIWAASLATVLVYRVGMPAVRSLRHDLRVTSVVPEADDTVSVYMSGRQLDRLPAAPGQFFVWRFLSGAGMTRGNPYSLSAAPDGRSLRITVKDLGEQSRRVRSIWPGTRVLIEGPYGRLGERARTRDRVVLIGAGVGITPLRSLAEGLDMTHGDAVLLHRYRDRPLHAHELDVLERERGLTVVPLPGPRDSTGSWSGTGDDPGMLARHVPDVAERDAYLCGPEDWTAHVRQTLELAGVPARQIHVESFRW